MPKVCKKEGCRNPVFGHGFCRSHQYMREDKKPKKTSTWEPNGELELYKEIWAERPHVSFVSYSLLDEYEGTEMFVNLFAHVLPKGRYPELRLQKDNIVLLRPYEHWLFDQGHLKQRVAYQEAFEGGVCDWKALYDLREELKEKYKKP